MVVLGCGNLSWLALGCEGPQWRLGSRLFMFLQFTEHFTDTMTTLLK